MKQPIQKSWARQYAPYACQVDDSRGRLHEEKPSSHRTPFMRDRDRIIHSTAFRRLKHKTQVFVYHEGDHYRTRLTHSIEVAQIASAIAYRLGLNEELAEAIALAHDLGHTPFGHAGEDALDEAMQPFGGFDHNEQTLRILTDLEKRYPTFDGLNLTWECLEGVVKHNGPLSLPISPAIKAYNERQDLGLQTYPSLEAQAAAIADDIAYNNHDIDDALRAGLLSLSDLEEVPFVGQIFQDVRKDYPGIQDNLLVHESIRRMIGLMIDDIVTTAEKIIYDKQFQSADDVRNCGQMVIDFSPAMRVHVKQVKEFLMSHVYKHYRVNRMLSKAKKIVKELFDFFMAEPECLPNEWFALQKNETLHKRAQVVKDYIAGMTDRYALEEYDRLFNMPKKFLKS